MVAVFWFFADFGNKMNSNEPEKLRCALVIMIIIIIATAIFLSTL